jgi:hypothetical protein
MNLAFEKEKIKKEIDLVDDIRILRAVHDLLSGYDTAEDTSPTMVNESPLTDEEMALPGGRVATKAQIDEWLDREEGEFLSGEDAFVYMKKRYEELKAQKKKSLC